jgi:hypothetical protein
MTQEQTTISDHQRRKRCFVTLFLACFDFFFLAYTQGGDLLDPATMPHPVNVAVLIALAVNAVGGAMLCVGAPATLALVDALLYPASSKEPQESDI